MDKKEGFVMGLFDKLKKKAQIKEEKLSYEQFSKWLDGFLDHGMTDVVALNFNLYEDGDDRWSIEVVGTADFDEEDDDWACDAILSYDKKMAWKESSEWETILEEAQELIRMYLERGEYSDLMKEYKAVAVGFVDGDLEIVYRGN